jgi:hypothetical protein
MKDSGGWFGDVIGKEMSNGEVATSWLLSTQGSHSIGVRDNLLDEVDAKRRYSTLPNL